MKKILKIGLLSIVSVISSAAIAEDCGCGVEQSERKFYIGAESGLSASLKKKFDIKDKATTSTAVAKLSRSVMYGAIAGYKFYPDMALEFGFQHKPFYKAVVTSPATSIPIVPGISMPLPSSSNSVKITSDLYLLGLVYNLKQLGVFTPYIGFDAGVARIRSKGSSIFAAAPLPFSLSPQIGPSVEVMHIKKTTCLSPAWQLTLGISTPDLIPNAQIYAAARLQAIHGIKLKYVLLPTLDPNSKTASFKKTLGVGEVVFGITYDLPF
jgi:hypothetical protein